MQQQPGFQAVALRGRGVGAELQGSHNAGRRCCPALTLQLGPTSSFTGAVTGVGPGDLKRLPLAACGVSRKTPLGVTSSHRKSPYNFSDTSGPSKASNPNICEVFGPRGHRGNDFEHRTTPRRRVSLR